MGAVAYRDNERGDDAGVARHHEISRRRDRYLRDRVHGHTVRGDGAAARRGEAALSARSLLALLNQNATQMPVMIVRITVSPEKRVVAQTKVKSGQ